MENSPPQQDIQNSNILLRDVRESDLPTFFEQQLDPDANYMAAFTAKNPADREAFMAHWSSILGDEKNTIRTILFKGEVAGSVSSYQEEESDRLEVTYWLGKPYWGKGIATKALSAFLLQVTIRPIYARVAKDNHASRHVLEKCGFMPIGEDKGFSNARGSIVEEFLLELTTDHV